MLDVVSINNGNSRRRKIYVLDNVFVIFIDIDLLNDRVSGDWGMNVFLFI